jgi:hypothetical protein
MWTVDTKANYLKYGNMGVHMMTYNSLKPSEMPELDDIDWGEDGLEDLSSDAVTVDATDWYTMTGMSVDRNNPPGGIYISVKHLSDGTTQTQKVLEQ